MERSTYIDWLLEQNLRADQIGDVARWLIKQIDEGFDPIDMYCLMERAGEDLHLTESIQEGLIEYALMIQRTGGRIQVIGDEETLQMKLESALRNEDYEKAAKLRDEINRLNQ